MPAEFSSIIMILLMVAIVYFLMIRPEQKRKKQAQELRNSLKKCDMITSIGGIVGKIVMVNENTIIIETSEDRVRMELTKWAVSTTGVQTSDMPEPQKKEKKDKDEKEPEETKELKSKEDAKAKEDKEPWEK